jgi:hypothetical protein
MFLCVSLGRFSRVMRCVMKMPLRRVRVMGRSFVVPTVMMFRRLAMMTGGVIVVFRSLAVVFRSFLGHIFLLCVSFFVSPDQEAETRRLYHVTVVREFAVIVAKTMRQTGSSVRSVMSF